MNKNYKVAIRWDFLTKYYDFLVAFLMKDKMVKKSLINFFANKNPHTLLDIGCGTGTLAINLQKEFPTCHIVGLDGDTKILAIAQQKITKENFSIEIIRGLSYELPFADNTFEAATCTIMLHHLSDVLKIQTLKEARRVLKVGGEINIADWGKPSNWLMRLLFHLVQIIDGYDTTAANVKGQIPEMMRQAGFERVVELKKINTILGTVSIYQGFKS